MKLGELIRFLGLFESDRQCTHGFCNPHSYRGFYNKLAFEPCDSMAVKSLREMAESAVESTYSGYKGGEYTMTLNTSVYLADYGSCGDEISVGMLLDWLDIKN
jgi:hypothetical protein